MLYLRTWVLIGLSVFVTFAQSEKLPKKWPSNIHHWMLFEEDKNKIDSGEINILCYNTWGLPISIYGHDQDERFSKIGDSISSKRADIIGLQETFHPELRDRLLKNLTTNYYTYTDYRCDRSIMPGIKMDCTGGLMTFSTFPIIQEQFFAFPIHDMYSLIEKKGSKGFLVSHIQHGKKKLIVINTHLYAGDNKKAEIIRLEQIKYIHSTIESKYANDANQTVMLGDFNVHHPDVACSDVYAYIVSEMDFVDSKPHIDKHDFTYSNANDYCPNSTTGSKLDYVFIKNNKKGKIISQSRIFDSKTPLSDHFGWQVKWKI